MNYMLSMLDVKAIYSWKKSLEELYHLSCKQALVFFSLKYLGVCTYYYKSNFSVVEMSKSKGSHISLSGTFLL